MVKYKFKEGLNRLEWNLRYEGPKPQPKSVFSLASLSGVKAPPGDHMVRLSYGSKSIEKKFIVKKDPRWSQSNEELIEQYEFTMKIKSLFNESHETIGQLRSVMDQVEEISNRSEVKSNQEIETLCKKILTSSSQLEEKLIQTKSESGQDPINHPSMIDDQIAYLYSNVNGQDHKPSEGANERFIDLEKELEPLLEEAVKILKDVEVLNERCIELKLPSIKVKSYQFKP